MSLIRRNHWLPAVFDELLNTDWMDSNSPLRNFGKSTPAVNVKENDNEFILEVAAPGMKKEDFKLELDNNVLSISSEKKEEKETEDKEEKFTLREFSYSSFKRSFTLPETVDHSKISADYKDGVLKIELPKREEAKVQPKRTIEIS